MIALIGFLFSFSIACTNIEGDEPGECTDKADNDGDGLFDCADSDCSGSPDCVSQAAAAKAAEEAKDAKRVPMPWELDTVASPHVMTMPAGSLELYIAKDGVYSVGKNTEKLVTIEEVSDKAGVKTRQIKAEELQGMMAPKLYDYLDNQWQLRKRQQEKEMIEMADIAEVEQPDANPDAGEGAKAKEEAGRVGQRGASSKESRLQPSDVDCEKRALPVGPILFIKAAKDTPFSIVKNVMFTGGQARWGSFGFVYGSERGLSKPTQAFSPKSKVWAEMSSIPGISVSRVFSPHKERSWKDDLCPVSHDVGLALNADKLEIALRTREGGPETKSYDCQQSNCTLADFGLDTIDGQLKTWHTAVKSMGHPYRIGDSTLILRDAQPIEDVIFITASLRNIGAGVVFAGGIDSNKVSMPRPTFWTSYGVVASGEQASNGNPDAGESAKVRGEILEKVDNSKAISDFMSDIDMGLNDNSAEPSMAGLNLSGSSTLLGGPLGAKGNQMGSGGLGMRGSGIGGGGTADGLGGMGSKGIGRGSSGYGRGSGSFGKKKGKLGRVDGRPLVLGSLEKALIEKVIKKNMNRIRYCYQRQLTKKPNLGGKVKMKFTIDKTGSVSNAKVQKSSVGSKAVDSCLVKVFRTFKFPAPKNGIVVVKYPFIFGS